jgi:hypothetical protein
MNKFIFLILLVVFSQSLFSQELKEVENQKLEQKIESISENTDKDLDFTNLTDDLIALNKNKININRATKDELLQTGLFDELRINALLSHIKNNEKLIEMYELQSIDGFDIDFIKSILPYIKIEGRNFWENNSPKALYNEGHNQLIIRAQEYIEPSRGYKADASSAHYPGSPLKLYARYRYSYKNKISFGLIGEKDAGEEFFNGSQKRGFDYYSAHLILRDIGKIKTLAIGDYELNYGQGLVMWQGIAFGKTPDVLSIKKTSQSIRPHTATDENNFMRGVAIAVSINKFEVSAFFSNKNIDANVINKDSLSRNELTVSSLQKTGYHRTAAEIEDRHSINETVYGGHVSFKNNNFNIGVTQVFNKYNAQLLRTPHPYNYFEFNGKANANTGLNYSYLYKNISFFGETARSMNGGIATLNGALLSLSSNVSFSVLQRYYQKEYQSQYGSAFGENSLNANEKGVFVGGVFRLIRSISLSAYADIISFPWLKYRIDAPSNAFDYLLQANYAPSKSLEIYVRYKHKTSEINNKANVLPLSYLVPLEKQSIRLNISYKVSPQITLRNRLELSDYHQTDLPNEKGYMIYQDIIYNPMASRVSISFRYAVYDTDTYNARIYAYENDVLYSYSIPSYYYKGSRSYITVQYTVAKGVDLWLRYAISVYDNQKTIGSYLDEIQGNSKSEVKAQLRMVF